MTRARPVITTEAIKCAFCKIGKISIMITFDYYSVHTTFDAGGERNLYLLLTQKK